MSDESQALLRFVQSVRDESETRLIDVQDAVTLENGGPAPIRADFEPLYRQIHTLATIVEYLLENRKAA